jgi:cytidine deaminase
MVADQELIERAKAVREEAYAPYSGFRVGASLLSDDGKVYVGCNVESASFGASLCAERAALACAVADGSRKFVKLIIFVGSKKLVPPCGICRQVLREFSEDLEIILANTRGDIEKLKLRDIFSEPFTSFETDED